MTAWGAGQRWILGLRSQKAHSVLPLTPMRLTARALPGRSAPPKRLGRRSLQVAASADLRAGPASAWLTARSKLRGRPPGARRRPTLPGRRPAFAHAQSQPGPKAAPVRLRLGPPSWAMGAAVLAGSPPSMRAPKPQPAAVLLGPAAALSRTSQTADRAGDRCRRPDPQPSGSQSVQPAGRRPQVARSDGCPGPARTQSGTAPPRSQSTSEAYSAR
jgi:hypothetical protein